MEEYLVVFIQISQSKDSSNVSVDKMQSIDALMVRECSSNQTINYQRVLFLSSINLQSILLGMIRRVILLFIIK